MKNIKSVLLRYGLPLAIFAFLLFLSHLIQNSFGLAGPFMIILMIATAWYFGRGPGLLIALLFEIALDYYGPRPYVFRSGIATFNRIVLFAAVVFFASSRRKAETHLRQQRERFHITLSSIGDAVIATDLAGKVNFINPTAEALTGWTMDQAQGKALAEIFKILNEDTREPLECPFTTIKRQGVVVGLAGHTLLITKDDREIPIEDSGAPIRDARGKMLGVIVVFHDITQRRQTERELERLLQSERRARSEAETADRLKDEFLATVSHELRTPLSAILGWSAMLNLGKLDEATAKKGLKIIERNANAQAEIIRDILDVSRIISGKLRIDSRPVQLAPIITSAVDTLKLASTAKGISLVVSIDPDAGFVAGDPDRLQQIVWNLLSNAIKFTPQNGEIKVALQQVDSHLELSVRDSGIGIEQDFLPHVFERFRQADSSTTRAYGGLGLGLAIVRHLVELHGGTVAAHSEGKGKGATFTVKFPIMTVPSVLKQASVPMLAAEVASDAAHSKAITLAGLRVLVVDDEVDSREVLTLMLNQFGAAVRTTASSQDAFNVVTEWKPDVLLSDLGMPGEDGYQLIARIRALPPGQGRDTPAAAVTAHVRAEDRRRAISAGYQIHIPKPVDPLTLVTAVAALGKKGLKGLVD
ncbi:MAG TPA: ATP-binding protein [Pyrinomonadaceae bacterium]|nr:ATP-binding protein [Pyrinomonadaceae bacterium]